MKGIDELSTGLAKEEEEMSKPVEPAYKQHILDLTQPIVDAEFLFSIGNIATIPEGELIAITGQAKQGKSQFEYYLIATMLGGRSLGGVSPLLESYKVLLFDTEQSQANLQKCCQRALRFADIPDNNNDVRFIPFFLRPLKIDERLKVIEEAIKTEKPNIVFIDGIRDLLNDFNDIRESNNLIQKLLRWITEYRCTIVCVLHQNKNNSREMRGHLGTELLNKVTDCFEVSKKSGVFTVSCTASRNVPCPALAFSINGEGDFCVEDVFVEVDRRTAAKEEKERVFQECFSDTTELRYGALQDAYVRISGKSKKTAERAIKSAVENGFLLKRDEVYSLSVIPSV